MTNIKTVTQPRLQYGEGISITIRGITHIYWIDVGGELRDLHTGKALRSIQASGSDLAETLIYGGATVLDKDQIKKAKEARREERKNTPDYELLNPFRTHGWANAIKKNIYRPRRG